MTIISSTQQTKRMRLEFNVLCMLPDCGWSVDLVGTYVNAIMFLCVIIVFVVDCKHNRGGE